MSIKKYFFSLWLIISLASASTILHAQESGWYLGAGGGLSKVDVNQNLWSDNSVSDASLETTGFAYQIYAGYRLHDNFALEISYLQPADTVFKGVSNGSITIWLPGNIQGDTHVAGTAFSLVAFWPGNPARMQLYLKGGLLMWDSKINYSATVNNINGFNDDGASPIGGGGIQLRLVDGWDLRAEALYSVVQLAQRENVGMGIAVLGISYSFK